MQLVKKGVTKTFQCDFQEKHISAHFRYTAHEQMYSSLYTNTQNLGTNPEVIGTL